MTWRPIRLKILSLMYFSEVHQLIFEDARIHTTINSFPCRRNRLFTKWLAEHEIPVLGPWPVPSPDSNPIKNLWLQMNRRVAEHNPTPATNPKKIIKAVWVDQTSLESCKVLATSMSHRIANVPASKGTSHKILNDIKVLTFI